MMTLDLGRVGDLVPTTLLQGTIGGVPMDVMVAGAGLTTVLGLSLYTIWRRRTQSQVPAATPSATSGFTRWLTPMGMRSIGGGQAVAARKPKTSGSMKAIKVSTPVSRVTARALRGADANPLEIARRTGLSRDGVAMMLATSGHPVAKPAAAVQAPAAQAPTRAVASAPAMLAPRAYATAPRTAPRTAPQAAARVLGSQFNARLG